MFSRSHRRPSSRIPAGAFTLVEVAASLAIVAFSLVSILGLIPMSLGYFREAIDTTVSAQLAQRVITDTEQTDLAQLIASADSSDSVFFVLPVRYFDEAGTEVQSDDPQAARKVIYHVRVRGSQPGPADPAADGDAFTSLPGATRFRPRTSAFLTVQVAWHPGLSPLPVDDTSRLWKPRTNGLSTYRAVITGQAQFAASTPKK